MLLVDLEQAKWRSVVGLFASNIGEHEVSKLFDGEEKWAYRMNRLRVGERLAN